MRLLTVVSSVCLLGAACAKGESEDGSDGGGVADASTGAGDDGGGERPDAGGGGVASSCPENQFATGLDESGQVECAPIDEAALAAVNQHCSIYLGWRDSCDGCSTAPAKWGATSGVSCVNGAGADNTCTTPALPAPGGPEVSLFGLNTDGEVNDDDKFYLGWHCVPPGDAHVSGPCPAGTFLWAISPSGLECVTAADAIAGYARTGCTMYTGWRDSCDGCTDPPAKWGRVNSETCQNGAGAANTCTVPTLGDQSVNTFGLNTDGDVDGNDKFYLGLVCGGAAAAEEEVDRSCPEGQLVVGIESNGRVRCASPVPAAEAVIQSSCHLYLGWRDSCDGCVTPPVKWGRVGHQGCEAGAGDAQCIPVDLGGTTMTVLGFTSDGEVDGNDKFYVGLRCE